MRGRLQGPPRPPRRGHGLPRSRPAGIGNVAAGSQLSLWRDSGILPASVTGRPPEDAAMVRVGIPEARRPPRLATTPMTRTARDLGDAWSRWRKHQARAR